MSKLEDDAEAFMRGKSEAAQLKWEQRKGIKRYRVPLHTNTIIPRLIVEGLLLEADKENDKAIGEAVGKLVMDRGQRFSRESGKIEAHPKRQTYKPKPQEKPKSGPVRQIDMDQYRREMREKLHAEHPDRAPTHKLGLPPDMSEPRRSGVKGRNVGVIPSPAPRGKSFEGEKMKQLSEAELKKREKKLGIDTPSDSSGKLKFNDGIETGRVNTGHDWENDK